jgi:hypothetical protein
MENPQVGTVNDRKDDAEMQSADGAAVAQPASRNAEFSNGRSGMGNAEYNTGMGSGGY